MEQGSSKKNNIIVLCVVIAVIAVALVAYFVISGQKWDGSPTVSATMELNTVNIYGAWYKKAGDSTYELRFKDNKELSYKQTAADGTVTAQSDEGTYDIADGKPLRIAAKLPLLCAFKKARLRRPEVYAAVKKHMRAIASVEAPYRGSRAFPRRKAAKNDSAVDLRSQTLRSQTLRSQTLRSPDLPANIFGEMLRDVLASAPVPKKEIPALKETGFFIGRFIYLCDAWDDRESDKKHSLFNPFNICGCTRDDAEFIINISINSAISAYNLLSTGRDRAILDNILFQGLFAVSDAVFAKEKQPLPNDGITTAAHKA